MASLVSLGGRAAGVDLRPLFRIMTIRSEPFGVCLDGRPVELSTLMNARGLEARIATYGGTLVSLRVPDRVGRLTDIVLGFDTLPPYLQDHPYFGTLIGRYANRIARGRFTLRNRSYQLAVNDGVNHLHGGPGGFHTVLWTAETAESRGSSQLQLRYRSPDGEQGYPGNLDVEVRYTLTDADELRLDYRARTDAPTIVNLTHHAYFNLRGEGTVLDHLLQVFASRYLPIDKTRIPRGTMEPVEGTPFDFRTPRAIGLLIGEAHEQLRVGPGYDHTWVLDKETGQMALTAEVYEPSSGRTMSLYTTQPGLQIYSGNFLDGTFRGKSGVAYARHAGFCIEPQHFPDSPNRPAFPSTVLEPGALFEEATIYRFGTAA